jgi:hypothetical protein
LYTQCYLQNAGLEAVQIPLLKGRAIRSHIKENGCQFDAPGWRQTALQQMLPNAFGLPTPAQAQDYLTGRSNAWVTGPAAAIHADLGSQEAPDADPLQHEHSPHAVDAGHQDHAPSPRVAGSGCSSPHHSSPCACSMHSQATEGQAGCDESPSPRLFPFLPVEELDDASRAHLEGASLV